MAGGKPCQMEQDINDQSEMSPPGNSKDWTGDGACVSDT